jgi:site-specific recombinase XerC
VSKKSSDDLLGIVFEGLKLSTVQVTGNNLNDFARYLRASSPEAAIIKLIAMPNDQANRLVASYKADLQDRVKPTVVKRRLAAVKSAVNRIRRAGRTNLVLDVPNPDVKAPRRLFKEEDWAVLRARAEAESAESGGRDLAILLLLRDHALRRLQVTGLKWPADVDLEKPAVRVKGQWLQIDSSCRDAIKEWLKKRGDDWAGPLFTSRRGGKRSPLSDASINHMVWSLARRAGLKCTVNPILLRQSGLDQAIKLTGDFRTVLKFGRISVATLHRHLVGTQEQEGSSAAPPPPRAVPKRIVILGDSCRVPPKILVRRGRSLDYEEMPPITEAQYDVVLALIKFHPNKIGTETLRNQNRSRPDRLLGKLAEDPRWGAVLDIPGKKGRGGYGLKQP